ncbi:hypothetical protein SERLA73DRAFT_169625 [Serpula lacrymans var. lacrymans S7.3]|uniref:Uncharacterized protein n=1 Tax=Serpula lacrymans var. lacrymans (strain S7.3) TaxID=936435 RepID=F8Q1Z1_SERL3|nr:hypothetical protein SERLA73DRAFT_169625 [Serpula lacrymans var. lacrymans S7.3]
MARQGRSPLSRVVAFRRNISTTPLTIGIRREDPSRIWERRCPITPQGVEQLVRSDRVKVLIQDCDRRIFPIDDFLKAGACIHPTLTPAHIVLGIKETPLSELVISPLIAPDTNSEHSVPRTHLMFSHTIKGQEYNMNLLSRFLGNSEEGKLLPRLIDYELLTGDDGKRTVGFGWFAGVAGALESLSAMAHSHLELGIASPFLYTPRPHTHPSVPSLRASLRAIGEAINQNGTPKSLGPFVVCVTGTGQVSQGALSILSELPVINIRVEDLPSVVNNPDTDLHKIYIVHVLPQDYLSRVDRNGYDRDDYYQHPEQYISNFHTRVAPYLTLFLNGIGWTPAHPRLMTNEQLVVALTKAKEIGKARFSCIGDISCDVEGGLEFMPRASTLSDPFFSTRPDMLPAHLPSVQIMSVDILPASLPLDASEHFSSVLMPYLKTLIGWYRRENLEGEQYSEAVNRATVTQGGKLKGKHAWLHDPLQKWASTVALNGSPSTPTRRSAVSEQQPQLRKKNVLMLGSGMVAGPAVDQICKRSDIELIVASNCADEANRVTRQHSNSNSIIVDMNDACKISSLISNADLVISLLPVSFHPSVAELCIKHRKHLVTASYISPAMQALHERAQAADVLLLNEIGLDPGIDHCSAISLLTKLKAQNKRIVSFTSFCGGLPAPESADVPLGYKFSWSPRGVLSAALNSARFKLNGKVWEIPGEDVLKIHFPNVPVSNVLKLEGIANRDSLAYASAYRLGRMDDLRTVLRGTLRYPGFSDLMHSFKSLGLLDTISSINLESWNSLACASLEKRLGLPVKNNLPSIISAASEVIPSSRIDPLLEALDWLSLTPHSSSASPLPPLPNKPTAPIDLFTTILAHKLKYGPKERDMVVLSHEIVAQTLSASSATLHGNEEIHTSSLIVYGNDSASAMARCVGLPVAFAALGVLDGNVSVRGVHGPDNEILYTSVLKGLESVGLDMKESFKAGLGIEEPLMAGLSNHNETMYEM